MIVDLKTLARALELGDGVATGTMIRPADSLPGHLPRLSQIGSPPTEAVSLESVKNSTRAMFAEALTVADVQVVIDAAARFKIIERAFDAKDMISPAVLNLRF